MKRPFAVIGFSMLAASVLVFNISYNTTVALLIGATVLFCLFLLIKGLRKYKYVIYSAFAVALYILSYIFTQYGYNSAILELSQPVEITGVVCETPEKSDYSFTYIIKPDGKNYKIRYVSTDNKMLSQGDRVKGTVVLENNEFDEDFFENSLSSKVYITNFEGEKAHLEKYGEANIFYKLIGSFKSGFTDIIDTYLPGENGAIAKAMTIGDRSEIDDKTIDHFNYAGTSHLLVISGLHLTLWSMGLINLLQKSKRLRKYSVLLGFACVFFYSALAGFSVSVIRAGAMVGMVLLGMALGRDGDSVNSIGLALAFILLCNPFAPLSVSLWFTTMSTLGILIIGQDFNYKIKAFLNDKLKIKNGIVSAIATTTAISIATTIFTLPIFIVKFRLLPITSFVSNIVMVDLALVLMISAVVGVVLHLVGLGLFADMVFTLVGTISSFLKSFAQKIALQDWSTLAIDHKYYEYFLVLAIVFILVGLLLRKRFKGALKHIAVVLSVCFLVLSVYCNTYNYFTPSVSVIFTDSSPILVANARGENILVNPYKKKHIPEIKNALNSYNQKSVDNILVTVNEGATPSHIISLYKRLHIENMYFCATAPEMFKEYAHSNVKSITLGGQIKINAENCDAIIELSCKNKHMAVINCENAENVFKNLKAYDIIILYGENALEYEKGIAKKLPETRVLVSGETKKATIYFK